MKKCIYCSDPIDIRNDDFQKIGKNYMCIFCYEDNVDEVEKDEDETLEDDEDDFHN